VFVLATPETTSIAAAYATIKALHAQDRPELSLVINRSDAERAALIRERIEQTARTFLHAPLSLAISIADDAVVPYSVSQRTPFVQLAPSTAATRGVRAWAEALLSQPLVSSPVGYFAQWWDRFERGTT
jgi:MinD-like ATPase involved in chromosome partitioning or flagellar assembly